MKRNFGLRDFVAYEMSLFIITYLPYQKGYEIISLEPDTGLFKQ